MLAVWELEFQENWLEWLPVLRLFIQTIGFLFCEHLLSFWDSGILAAARQMVPTWLTPSKNPGLQYLGEFSGQIAFYIRCHSSLLGKLSASCVTPLGKDPRMPIPGFFQTLPHVPFLFAVFALLQYITGWEWQYAGSCVRRPPSDHWTWCLSSGTWHWSYYQLKVPAWLMWSVLWGRVFTLQLGQCTVSWRGERADVGRTTWNDVCVSSLKAVNHYQNKCTVILFFLFHNTFQSLLWVRHYVHIEHSVIYPSGNVRPLCPNWTRQTPTSPPGWAYRSDSWWG